VALKPDGKSARTERVSFTRPAAERIAQAVRTVEQGDRDSAGLRFPRPIGVGGGEGKAFRICTFTGSWAKSTIKTVTLKYQTATPNTFEANNLFANISASTSTSVGLSCAIAREGTAWFLIAAEC
jgi:hypothetical protein